MENQEVLRSKPLSYEASKAVLKSLSLETREVIKRRIPALRTINSRLPYVLENVVIRSETFETNGRRWIIELAWAEGFYNPKGIIKMQDRHVADPRRNLVTVFQGDSRNKAQYSVNKSSEEVNEQLFDEYIRDGTVVSGSLCFCGIPEFLKGRREDLKMKVTNLELTTKKTEDYEPFVRFIDLDVLENVKLVSAENSLAILDNTEDWITTGREIGTRFSWAQIRFEDVANILEQLKTQLGAVEAGSNLEYYFSSKTIYGNSTTLKMGEDRELVMFCERLENQSERLSFCLYTFEMEVVMSTTAGHDV
ncbi:hypothetical protein CRE_14500 [Caenorhabditis remanei]|uniref:DUF38 domain-containing protein n=1 Tax=Caenorhabditis remanei TaxID=31234 RepID=E3M984_CAERE|nr:hypothetical protein CRE_14500 [Caenorhabditis remanei]